CVSRAKKSTECFDSVRPSRHSIPGNAMLRAVVREAPPKVTLGVRAAQEGDEDALRELLLGVLPRVRNLVRYLVPGDMEGDDLAQEALVSVIRGLPQFRGDGAFESWVDRIVARSVFAVLRARKLRTDRVADLILITEERDAFFERRYAVELLDRIPL